jgi:hypothetical protein
MSKCTVNHRATLSTAAAALLAVGLLIVSPKTCSCIPPDGELGYLYELPGAPTATSLQVAASQKFMGQDISTVAPPSLGVNNDCSRLSSQEVLCQYWLEDGVIREVGLQLLLKAEGGTAVTKVIVASVSRWFKR